MGTTDPGTGSDRHYYSEVAAARKVEPHSYRLGFRTDKGIVYYENPILLTDNQAKGYVASYGDGREVQAVLARILNNHRHNRQVHLAREQGGDGFGTSHLAGGLVASLEEPQITLRQIASVIPSGIRASKRRPLELILQKVR